MLPEGFRWAARHQYDRDGTALLVGSRQVAMLIPRLDGGWFARLDAHHQITAPLVTRNCASLESGRAGIEAWACREADRLREEVSG